MSILNNLLGTALSVAIPIRCPGCGATITSKQGVLCIGCRSQIYATEQHLERDNKLCERLREKIPSIESAAAQFYYVDNGVWRNIIHSIKYNGNWALAYRAGYWYGSELSDESFYREADLLVPVPIHRARRLERGYNQSDYIALGIGKALSVGVATRAVVRKVNNNRQVECSRKERWTNVEDIFEVRQIEVLRGKHILLVDDVCTTGATILSCADTILRAVPDVRISILTLGVTLPKVSK